MAKHYELTLRIYEDDQISKICDYRSKTDRVELSYDLSCLDAALFTDLARNVRNAKQYDQMMQIVPRGTEAVAVDAPPPPATPAPAPGFVEPPTTEPEIPL